HLIGDNSSTHPKTVSVGRGRQIENFTARTVHHGKDTESFILQHGVMRDKATAIFNAIGKIENEATSSNAEQESRSLKLSDKTPGNANPILQTDENDVNAGHAASVSRNAPPQPYYVMRRGTTREEAENAIIFGLIEPAVHKLPNPSVQKQLRQVIEN